MTKSEEYRGTAKRCREEAKHSNLLERRLELEAQAEHLEEIATQMAETPSDLGWPRLGDSSGNR